MAEKLSPQVVLRRARQQLALARQGQRDIAGTDAERHVAGIYNAVVHGRSVLYVLEHLKSSARKQFTAWYALYEQVLWNDPLLSWLLELRNTMLKEGGPEHHVDTALSHWGPTGHAAFMRNAPPGTCGYFFGDQAAGTGYLIEQPDGSTERYYVALPPDLAERVSVTMRLPDQPDSHLGLALPDTSINTLVALYLDYLERLLDDADREFAGL